MSVHSATKSFQLPSVIRLRQYIRPYFAMGVRLSRQNVFLRDENTCQYCLKVFSDKRLTIDHVHPQSKGGKHEWTNVVAACSPCNNKKGDRTLRQNNLTLPKKPIRPKWVPHKRLGADSKTIPTTWAQYLQYRLTS